MQSYLPQKTKDFSVKHKKEIVEKNFNKISMLIENWWLHIIYSVKWLSEKVRTTHKTKLKRPGRNALDWIEDAKMVI